jgi:hypothetical protein
MHHLVLTQSSRIAAPLTDCIKKKSGRYVNDLLLHLHNTGRHYQCAPCIFVEVGRT